MIRFFVYLIEVSIILSLLYLVYLLFINDTFYNLKRGYILISIVISFIIPQFPAIQITEDFKDKIAIDNYNKIGVGYYSDTFEQVVFGSVPDDLGAKYFHETSNANIYLLSLFIIYVLGISVLSYKFIAVHLK